MSSADPASSASSSFISCSDSEGESFDDASVSNFAAVMPPKKVLDPVDPKVLANAEPWVKLLFDRFDMVEERFDSVDKSIVSFSEGLKLVQDKQDKTDEDVKALQTDCGDLRSDMDELEDKVSDLSADFSQHKAKVNQKLSEIMATLEARASTPSVQIPSLSVAQQCSVEDKFRALLEEAGALQTIFVIGKVPDVPQTVSLSTVLQRHFVTHGAKLLPVVGKSFTRRFSVPLDKVEATKSTVRHYNLAIRDLGWWIVQDTPPALRKMNSNAFAFFKYSKGLFKPLRHCRFDAEDGYVLMDELRLFPVYLIPTKQLQWKRLSQLLAELVADFLDVDWLDSAAAPRSVPERFLAKWCAVIKQPEVNDGDDSDGVETETHHAHEEGMDVTGGDVNATTGGG